MDTIILTVLLVGAVLAVRGARAKVLIPVFVLGFVMTALLFNHHATSTLNLSF
ncbi:MAG: DUF5993 family protein [Candidatus Nanopelagicales bacterium]|nr:hypothetical protein [Candidatus Nanopelagicales bacterium]